MASMQEKWQAQVRVLMRLICEQNAVRVTEYPDVPAELYDGTGLTDRSRMVDIAYNLLYTAGIIGLKDQKGVGDAKEE